MTYAESFSAASNSVNRQQPPIIGGVFLKLGYTSSKNQGRGLVAEQVNAGQGSQGNCTEDCTGDAG
jgi:hypothetical protein